jgi:hypothetical protein
MHPKLRAPSMERDPAPQSVEGEEDADADDGVVSLGCWSLKAKKRSLGTIRMNTNMAGAYKLLSECHCKSTVNSIPATAKIS